MLLCFALVGCGNSTGDVTNNDSTGSSAAKENTGVQTDEENQSIDLPVTYQIPLKNVYIDAPNFQHIEEGYTQLFIVHESKYVAFTADSWGAADSAKAAHGIAFDIFKTNMQNYEGGVNGIALEKEEIKQINGLEVYSFEGKINYGRDTVHDGYAKGYSFVLSGVPCEIIGSVIDDNQSQDLVNEISAIVDAMIKTARETN